MEYSLYLFIHLFNAHFKDILNYITVDNSYPIVTKWYTKLSWEENVAYNGSEYCFVEHFLEKNNDEIEKELDEVADVDF